MQLCGEFFIHRVDDVFTVLIWSFFLPISRNVRC